MDRVQVGHSEKDRAAAHVLAGGLYHGPDLHVPTEHHPSCRCPDLRVLERDASVFEVPLRPDEGRPGVGERQARGLVLFVRDVLGHVQGLGSLELGAGVVELCFRYLEVGLGLGEGVSGHTLIDSHQQVSAHHTVAGLHGDLDDLAGRLGLDLNGRHRLDRACGLRRQNDIARLQWHEAIHGDLCFLGAACRQRYEDQKSRQLRSRAECHGHHRWNPEPGHTRSRGPRSCEYQTALRRRPFHRAG